MLVLRCSPFALCALTGLVLACTNDPYPRSDAHSSVFYSAFTEAPKSLDPAVAYNVSDHAIIGNIFDTLLEYHYLARPYTLIPGLAVAVPEAQPQADGRVRYHFELRDDLLFQDDPCFALGQPKRSTRQLVAADVAFALARIADPAVNSPVTEPFSHIVGLRQFGERLEHARRTDARFARLPVHQQYARVGPIEGLRPRNALELEVVLTEAYPQLLYWFAMPFSTPIPWEATAYYDGRKGRPTLADHPVGSGPYRLTRYDKQARIVLDRNEQWYGLRHPEWRAPGATYPAQGEAQDRAAGLLDPRVVGQPLASIKRIDWRREKEPIPLFNKFLQGYYDAAGIIRESFDKVIREERLSPEMRALGVRLNKSVIPAVYYIGFNMDDAVVGVRGGERSRLLRQAMSLAIDAREYLRLFSNGRGISAQSPLPPGIYGYEAGYRNPFRQLDVARATALLRQAGYPGGIDPRTRQPLRLTFDSSDTTAQGLLRYRFFVDAWRRLGLDVRVAATTYNQFQQKVRDGAYQLFLWGWVADYPDPENFLFLLSSEMARSRSGGPNTANFADARFDRLFLAMKTRSNDAERLALIRQLRAVLEHERPWIELFHPEDYTLFHGWLGQVKPTGMAYPTVKYRTIDLAQRAAQRQRWNRPVLWPLYLLLGLALAIGVPAVITFFREQQ
ncbi:MAG: peptide ABC transporter substrate-binding protein [Proteobacteria bacterium]|nr:peptide ABC transporter substrate-binding protein [Pseudomonadota bacterium]